MTSKNLALRADLIGLDHMPNEKDSYLCETYCLTEGILEGVRSSTSQPEQIKKAAQSLIDSCRAHHIVPEGDIAAQITTTNLAAMVESEWENPLKQERNVRKNLGRIVSQGKWKNVQTRLQVSNVHLFLQDYDIPTGNLIRAAEVYPNFTASWQDFLAAHTIPLEPGFEVGVLMGVIGADGYIGVNGVSSWQYSVQSNRTEDTNHPNFKFYEKVSGLLSSVFNADYPAKLQPNSSGDNDFLGIGAREWDISQIRVSSKAICSWLLYDMGMENMVRYQGKGNTIDDFPALESEDLKQGFFVGSIAAKARLSGSEYPLMRIRSRDSKYRGLLQQQGVELGHSSRMSDDYTLSFNSKDFFLNLLHNGFFIHPHHKAQVSRYFHPNFDVLELSGRSPESVLDYCAKKSHLSYKELGQLVDIHPSKLSSNLDQNEITKVAGFFRLAPAYFGGQ